MFLTKCIYFSRLCFIKRGHVNVRDARVTASCFANRTDKTSMQENPSADACCRASSEDNSVRMAVTKPSCMPLVVFWHRIRHELKIVYQTALPRF